MQEVPSWVLVGCTGALTDFLLIGVAVPVDTEKKKRKKEH